MNLIKIKIKKLLTLFFFIILCFANTRAQDMSTALGYMQKVSGDYSNIQNDSWAYTRAVAKNKGARKIENKRKELLATLNTAIGNLKRIKGFKDDTSYRDSTLKLLEVYKILLNEDYGKIVELEEISEQSYDNMEAYLLAKEKAGEVMRETAERASNQEKEFAQKHNITLIEKKDKIEKKLENAAEVNDYYNKVFLIFFKAYKQEVYLLEATAKNDVNAMEQNRNTLQKFAEEGILKLNDLKAFRGDGSLIAACRNAMTFFKSEAETKYKPIMDFQLKKDDFEKAEKAMKSKSEKSRTKEDVDAYNKAANVYNSAIKSYNDKNKELHDGRKRILDSWNNAADTFTSSKID